MAIIETLQDINLRVANILQQQQQLKTQALNWEKLYREATDIQKKLLEQSTGYSKQNEILYNDISNLKSEIRGWEQKHEQLTQKQASDFSEMENMRSRLGAITKELQSLRLKEEQQISLHFGAEKEQEKLKTINDDLKEQLAASQELNKELQTELQNAKITLVEEQAQANNVLQQRNSLEKEIVLLKENYQKDLSEVHSKNSQVESQAEKLNAETRKLQEALEELSLSNTEKQEASELMKSQISDLEARLSATPIFSNEHYLLSRIEQLTAQIYNLQFEKELMKKTMTHKETGQPAKIAEMAKQQPASNNDQVEFLYSELRSSQKANSELEKQLNHYIEIISGEHKNANSSQEGLKNLQEQNKIVKLAEAIEGNTVASNIELKQKLNEMIKEVDRCIAKLSS